MEDLDSFEAIGRTLKYVREQRNISAEEAAKHLRIRLPYLHYLELGDIGHLPGIIYARGYLQRYTMLLELNEITILSAFDKIANFPHRRTFNMPEVLSRDAPPDPRLVLGTLAVGLLLLLASNLAHSTSYKNRHYVLPLPELAKEEPAEEAADPDKPAPCKDSAQVYPPCYWSEMPVNSNQLLTIENTELKTE